MRKTKRNILLMMFSIVLIMSVGGAVMFFKPHASVAEADAMFTLSVSELVDAFTKDESQANAKYGGKILQVRGPLKEMISNDSTLILIMGDSTRMTGVSCYLQNNQKDRSKSLRPGEGVIVKGICNGMLLDVVMDKCVLLSEN